MIQIKRILTRKTMLYIINHTNNTCECSMCIKKYIDNGKVPCVCTKLDMPCIVLKSKYATKKALLNLVRSGATEDVEGVMLTPCNESMLHMDFVNAIRSKEKVNGKKENDI